MFTRARKKREKPSFVSPYSYETLRKYWETPEFQKLSKQNHKNRNSSPDSDRPSKHTCSARPMPAWCGRLVMFATSLPLLVCPSALCNSHLLFLILILVDCPKQRWWPTDIVLFSDTHQSRDPKTKGKWMDDKSQRKAVSPYTFLSKGQASTACYPHMKVMGCSWSHWWPLLYHFDITSMYISFRSFSLGLIVIQVTWTGGSKS